MPSLPIFPCETSCRRVTWLCQPQKPWVVLHKHNIEKSVMFFFQYLKWWVHDNFSVDLQKRGGDFIEFLGLQIAQLGSTNTSHSSRFLAPSLSIASQNLAIKIHHDVENTCHLLPSIYLGKFDICFTRRKLPLHNRILSSKQMLNYHQINGKHNLPPIIMVQW